MTLLYRSHLLNAILGRVNGKCLNIETNLECRTDSQHILYSSEFRQKRAKHA